LLWILEASGLSAVDALRDVAVEEHIGNIKLMRGPVLAGDESEHGADHRRLADRRECLLEVDAGSLMKATDNPPGFVTLEGAVGVQFVLEHPLAGDGLASVGRGMSVHVLLCWRASNSSCIAARQFGSRSAARTEVGTGDSCCSDALRAYLGFGLTTPARAQVSIWWRGAGGGWDAGAAVVGGAAAVECGAVEVGSAGVGGHGTGAGHVGVDVADACGAEGAGRATCTGMSS